MFDKLKIGLMGLAAKPIPPEKGNICAPNEIVYHLASLLQEVGHEVIVFTGSDSASELTKISAGQKSTWNQFGTDRELSEEEYKKHRIEYEITLTKEAINAYKNGLIEVINSHDFRTSPPFFAEAGVPVLYTVHGSLRDNPLLANKQFIKILKKFCFLNISQDNEKLCREKGLRSAYTPNGVDVERFAFSDSNRFGLLVVSRIVPEKKIKESIEAAIRLNEKITLVGPPGNKKNDLKYFAELQKYFNHKNVKYLGFLNQDQIVPLYQKARVLLLLSQSEGMPLSVLEAQATGLPVVASCSEVIVDGRTGYITKDFKNDLDKKIILAKKLSPLDCRQNALKYSYQNMVNNYLRAYRSFK